MKKLLFIIALFGITKANAQDWSLTGNAGTDTVFNFIGTTDVKPFVIRTGNSNRILVKENGYVGIGTSAPAFHLHFNGGKFNLNATSTTASSFIKSKYKLEIQNGTTSTTFAIFDAINKRVGIGTTTPTTPLDIQGDAASADNVLFAKANFVGNSDVRAVDAYSKPAAGYGYGVYAQGGYQGVYGFGLGGAGYASNVYGVNGQATGTAGTAFGVRGNALGTGTNYGVYGAASGGTINWSGYFTGNAYVGGNVGIGTLTPVNKLEIVGVITATGNAGIGTNAPISRLSLYQTGTSSATADIKNLTMGPNISWIHFGTSGDWYIRSAANAGKVILQDQNANAKVSIGTGGGSSKLNVVQSGTTISTAEFINASKGPNPSYIHFGTKGDWYLRSAADAGSVILQDQTSGTVCIGTNTPATGYKLSVKGKIISEEFKVQLQANWPDYVFNDDYRLTSIYDLEKSIKQNKHLPGIPSAGEINNEGGFLVGEMQTKLLEKVEELTLYIINQQKEIDELKSLIKNK